MIREPLRYRKCLRLRSYDYARAGAYFVTVTVQHRLPLFGEVVEGEMRLNDAGDMVKETWYGLTGRFPTATLDEFVVMPNHVHGIIVLGDYKNRPYKIHETADRRGEPRVRPDADGTRHPQASTASQGQPQGTADGSLGRIIQAFKSLTTHAYIQGIKRQNWITFDKCLWQRNYYEHIIRSEDSLEQIRDYIETNPLRWHLDEENPDRERGRPHGVAPTGNHDS